ncbi:sodium-independent sulfate anion transporter-like isoform X3 [Schistocerca gregaria]|uniref:sodium-independent sulfate anion transporter-like isoform X3 n=1 Tax=Schistocerca gregaria TaxID=7010 RepID=UPI00211DE787|nr:sodium-independent sulfate anion transporter-like isoform X3 [Schistocerca gregaria]
MAATLLYRGCCGGFGGRHHRWTHCHSPVTRLRQHRWSSSSGFIIDFISGPVSSGFTSAAALMIVTSQMKDLLGITAEGSTFIEVCGSLFKNMHNTKLYDSVLGAVCIVVLLLMRVLANFKIGPKDDEEKTTTHRILNKAIWLTGTSRNAILVIICGIIGHQLSLSGDLPLNLIGPIPPGLPAFQLPPFTVTLETGNSTVTYSFGDMCSHLGSGIFIVPLVALLENIAVCKAFSNGKPTDATQELLAIGISNIGNSFVQGFPGTGALARSAVNNSSGVRSTFGGLYTENDLIPGFATLFACLILQLELGILVGIGFNVVFILYNVARPKIMIETKKTAEGTDYLELTPDRCLIFPSVEYVRNLVVKHSMRNDMPVVINCSHIFVSDYTAAKVVDRLTHDFSKRQQPLFFYKLKPSIVKMFQGLHPTEFVDYQDENELESLIRGDSLHMTSLKDNSHLSSVN